MKTTYHTHTPQETMSLGQQLGRQLVPGVAVLLFGDLGSGKTHFTKGLAKGLGIDEVIKSPTFTYVNAYALSGQWSVVSGQPITRSDFSAPLRSGRNEKTIHVYHYDLYRLNPGDNFYSIGLEDTLNDPGSINIIEWADRMGDMLPTNYIRVDFKAGAETHELQFSYHDSEVVSEAQVEGFYETWATPLHVRKHCEQVANVAMQVGQAYMSKNLLINFSLLKTAALLHDMARVCDFTDLDPSKFQEEVTEEKWEKWSQLRKDHAGQNHADIGADHLIQLGYHKTAALIRAHHSLTILDEPHLLEHLETAILYYADKRAMHDHIVSLSERFEDGRRRYGHLDHPGQKKRYLEVEQKTMELEEWLFSEIDIKPDDIR